MVRLALPSSSSPPSPLAPTTGRSGWARTATATGKRPASSRSSPRRAEEALVGADPRRVRRPGGRRAARSTSPTTKRPASSRRTTRASPSKRTRQGTRPLPGRQDRQGAVEARVRLPLRGQLPGRPALHPDGRGRQGVRARDDGRPARLDAEKGTLVVDEGLQEGLRRQDADLGVRRPPARRQEPRRLPGRRGQSARRVRQGHGQGSLEIAEHRRRRVAGYCPPTLIEAGGTKQLVIWHPKKMVSVNPDDGKQYWDVDLKPYQGMSIMAPRQSGDYLFAGGIGWSAILLEARQDEAGGEGSLAGETDNQERRLPGEHDADHRGRHHLRGRPARAAAGGEARRPASASGRRCCR